MKVLSKLRAVTLVSLLIGMSLGAFLIISMLQIFSTTQANYKLAQNLAELNDVVRYASVVMTEVVGQAGYRVSDPTTGLPTYSSAFPEFTGTLTGPGGSYNFAATNASDEDGLVVSYFPGQGVFVSPGNVDTGDKLWVKFYGDSNGSIRDCNDLYGSETTPVKIRFYSREITVNGNLETAYYCEKHLDATNYTYDDTPVGTELIPAELFDTAWVRYGEDITGTGYIDRWIEGDDVADRNKVFAVRVAFLVHTRDDVRSSDVTQTFDVFGATITRTSKKIYKLAMFTILLPYAQNYTLSNRVVAP